METPPTAHAGDYLVVSGWAAATSSMHLVKTEVLVDGISVVRGTDFIPRPDIAALYGRPDFSHSGWRHVIHIRDIKPGEHEIQLRVTGSDGTSVLLFTRKLTILE